MISISSERKKLLISFSKKIGVYFKDISLLDLAFHHRSFSNESDEARHLNNERLEFLGDSVLGLVAADFLYKDMKDNQEGDLAKIKAQAVSEKALAPVALKLGMDSMLVLGKGEEMSGGRTKPAILADCVEAVIASIYLDCGFETAQKFVLSFIVPEIQKLKKNGGKDYKTILQETYQKESKKCPVYEVVSVKGPDHDRIYGVRVHLGDTPFGIAEGKSKKEAEQLAAKIALEAIGAL